MKQFKISLTTTGRGSYNITQDVQAFVRESKIEIGLCNIFVQHTSASLMLCENADPQVRDDLETFMAKIAPDGDPMFLHTDEGPDDMTAHVRTVLTASSLTIPVSDGHCALGVWQGLYLWEHRTSSFNRNIIITIQN